MTYGLRILPAADADVDEAAFFIAQDDLAAALRLYDAVEESYRRILDHPQLFPNYDIDHPRLAGLRKCSVHSYSDYLIFYRIDVDMIEVIRVLHGARDLTSILSDDPINGSSNT